MSHLMFVILVILTAGLLSKVEIEIENGDGYAKNLPVTWRTENPWLRSLIGGTSYHLYMGLFLLVFLHSVVIIIGAWTLQAEFLILSFLAFVTVAEDFMWFVLNPHFRIKKFKRECIPWFKDRWLFFCPLWYWYYMPLAIILYWLGVRNGI